MLLDAETPKDSDDLQEKSPNAFDYLSPHYLIP